MFKGVGVSGEYVMGTVIRLEEDQLKKKADFLQPSMADVILMVPDISVKDLLELERYHVVGLVAEAGNYNSHAAIQIRKMGMTAVLGVPGCMQFVSDGEKILLDGINGNVIVNPRESTIKQYQDMREKAEARRRQIDEVLDEEAVTKDGYRVVLQGNVEDLQDIDKLIEQKGDGVGLFRTENFFVGRSTLPTEEEQYELYVAAAQRMKGKTITIRTLDAGSNIMEYLEPIKEDNPFLGCRGIRLSLRRSNIFRSQCRAIFRASVHGSFRILLPMLTTISELHRVQNVFNLIKEELEEKGIPYDKHLPVGVMIETPAAAWMADAFAREADFISIGSNDLTQYMLAADRGNKYVSDLYSHYDPAVLRSIQFIVECCKKEHTPVYICGEAASDEHLLPLLLVYGIDELSVNVTSLLAVRKQILDMNLDRYRDMAETVSNAITVEEVKNCIDAYYRMYQNF